MESRKDTKSVFSNIFKNIIGIMKEAIPSKAYQQRDKHINNTHKEHRLFYLLRFSRTEKIRMITGICVSLLLCGLLLQSCTTTSPSTNQATNPQAPHKSKKLESSTHNTQKPTKSASSAQRPTKSARVEDSTAAAKGTTKSTATQTNKEKSKKAESTTQTTTNKNKANTPASANAKAIDSKSIESQELESNKPESTNSAQTPNSSDEFTLDSSESVTVSSSLPAPLPLQIKPRDILHSKSLRDNQQNITLQKRNDDNGLTIIEVYDELGVLRAKLSFKGDKLEGISTAYKNGEIAREIPYKNGLVDGLVITYLSPTKRIESNYKAGKKHGKTTIYHNNEPTNFKEYRNGILHGVAQMELTQEQEATTSESSKSRTIYNNGKKQGESIGYADDKVVFKQQYNQGMLQGQTQTFGENAIIKITREYKNNLLHGKEIVYNYPQQTIAHTSTYELGVLISPYENFKDNSSGYFSMKPNDLNTQVTRIQNTATQELWEYDNNQTALEITKNGATKQVRVFYKNGVLASEHTITPQEASGHYYTPDSTLESKTLFRITQGTMSKTTWLYAPQGQLRTKSQESPAKSVIQSYKNGALESEVIALEDEETTIQKHYFPNGALEFEHYYMEDRMIQGTLYAKDGKIVYAFPHTNEDMIFDEAFPNTAAKKRAQVLPRN